MEMMMVGSRTNLEILRDYVREITEESSQEICETNLTKIKETCQNIEKVGITPYEYSAILYEGFKNSYEYSTKTSIVFAKHFLKEITENFEDFEDDYKAEIIDQVFNIQVKANKRKTFDRLNRWKTNKQSSKFYNTVQQRVHNNPHCYTNMIENLTASKNAPTDQVITAYATGLVKRVENLSPNELESSKIEFLDHKTKVYDNQFKRFKKETAESLERYSKFSTKSEYQAYYAVRLAEKILNKHLCIE